MLSVLPDKVDELQDLLIAKENVIYEKDEVIQAKETYISELEKKNEILIEKIKLFEKYRYGRSSEKWTEEDKAQLILFNEAETAADEAEEELEVKEIKVSGYTYKVNKKGKSIPDDIPRNEIIHELTEEERRCSKTECPKYSECQKLRPVLGKEESEELKYIPATIEADKHIRYSYGQIKCEYLEEDENIPAVIRAPREKRLIPGSIATPSLLAYVAVSKFSDALPFYRQERLFGRIGIEISRQTMSNWMIKASSAMAEFIKLLEEWVLSSQLLNMDETTLQVLHEAGKPVQSKSYMWIRVGNRIDENGNERKIILFNYFRDRKKKRVAALTEGYKGVIQTDGYSGYDEKGSEKGIWHVGCWAHARRKFNDAYKGSSKGKMALTGLGFIQKLYAIERRLRKEDLKEEEFVLKRRQEAIPVLKKFIKWMKEKEKVVVPESLAGKAISYTLNEYVKLVRYLKYAYITPDNNVAERGVKPFTIGRKNWLFNNTPSGAYASAAMYSLVETAKANNLEPYRYMEKLFEKIPEAERKEDLERLLPWNMEGVPFLKLVERKDSS